MPFAKSRSRPDRSQRKAKLHKRIVSTNYAVPTGNLDRRTGEEIIAMMKRANRELRQTQLLITHDERIALQADRMLWIEDGRILRDERIRVIGGAQQ